MILQEWNRHPASFRDPAGTVFLVDKRIIRGLTDEGAKRYLAVKKSGLLDSLEQTKKIITSTNIDLGSNTLNPMYVHHLEHDPIEFISYPYEWPFLLLKDAALLHLSIQLEALERDIVLIDASAYNIQFKGISPLFIDVLSFRPYQSGEFWTAHRQFCEQFLNPLLLSAIRGVPYQEWYRGALEGIPTELMANLMPFKSWFSIKSLLHILLPARSQKLAEKHKTNMIKRSQKTVLPKAVYKKFLKQLNHWIRDLKPRKPKLTQWENYTETRLYNNEEVLAKKRFIAEFVSAVKPNQLWDLGCNDGEFAEIALNNGVKYVVGFDIDIGALDKAVQRAKKNNLNFLPLYQQLTNPTPNQGWLSVERSSINGRGSPNAVIALAFIHHLSLGHNIPLSEVVQWIINTSPKGVIEFVQKTDPTIQQMLALKGDIFPNYSEEAFISILEKNASVIKTMTVSESGRRLYWYERI